MASFRNGIKIFGEFSLKQGLGRIRSFSEDRKPGRWLPEDQWAVRQPGSTCPDPCKPKKPPKPSKSWLSICKDPEPPITCDIRHNNCPPPPPPKEGPWYSLDNLIPKKKPEKPPPLYSCREEKKRREAEGREDEVCEKMSEKPKLEVHIDNEDSCCIPKPEPPPAPVVTLSAPLPKELDIMLWCGRPSTDRSKIAMKCQSDRLPYEEFRPQKCWKPLPFSLPCKSEPISAPSFNRGCIPYAEFKQVEVPKPLYTRYKTVELCNKDFLLCMAEVKCPDDKEPTCLPVTTSVSCYPPPPSPCSSDTTSPRRSRLPPCCKIRPQPKPKKKPALPEKRVIEAASCKPVKIKKATEYTFRPKLTKLIERRVPKNPFASCKRSNPESRPDNEENDFDQKRRREDYEPPKVLTGTLTKEPQIYERDFCANNPPSWMYVLCKPGCKETPLIPKSECVPDEPDWSSETDGLNFYNNENGNIVPKPPPDPCNVVEVETKPVVCEPQIEKEKPAVKVKRRLVLMPENYNIKYSRCEDPCAGSNESESSFDEFIQAKTSSTKKCSKSYPQMKENILYDLQRLCPSPPLDPTKLPPPCRTPVEDPCAPRFFRCYSTFTSSNLRNLTSVQLQRLQARTECGDSSGKCKPRKLLPKKVQCPEEKPKATCAQLALPCCRKAVVPPSCQIRKPMPLCKKKLPPRPSFSECAREPPPCPKMTECNAWEKRMREDNKRKYSDWAFLRNEFDIRQLFPENAKPKQQEKDKI